MKFFREKLIFQILHDESNSKFWNYLQDGSLDWNEFIVFSRPEEFEETYTQATGSKYKKFDEDKDKRYSLEEFQKFYSHNVLIPDLLPEEYRKPAVGNYLLLEKTWGGMRKFGPLFSGCIFRVCDKC